MNAESRLILGDCREVLKTLEADSVHACITSPPYFALRDYQCEGQIGLEPTPREFVEALVEVFREVRRVLHPSGVLFLNLGDSYASGGRGGHQTERSPDGFHGRPHRPKSELPGVRKKAPPGVKDKDLLGVPWMTAFALRNDGWWLRSEIIWAKKSCMPSSVTDRPTTSHEHLFLLTKESSYFYDQEADRRPHAESSLQRARYGEAERKEGVTTPNDDVRWRAKELLLMEGGGNLWTVWDDIRPSPMPERHFATFPPDLPRRCVKLGTSRKGCCPHCKAPWVRVTERKKLKRERPNDLTKRTRERGTGNACGNTVAGVEVKTLGWEPSCKCPNHNPMPCMVLDCFMGSGTTGLVARLLGRSFVGIELNPDYLKMAERQIRHGRPTKARKRPAGKTVFDLFKTGRPERGEAS